MKKKVKVGAAIGLVGLAAGAVAGLLLAPKKGSELRLETQEKYQEVKSKVSDTLTKMRKKEQEVQEVKIEVAQDTQSEEKQEVAVAEDQTEQAS
jgi:gas vesicle protein